jgi:hypothetical protein
VGFVCERDFEFSDARCWLGSEPRPLRGTTSALRVLSTAFELAFRRFADAFLVVATIDSVNPETERFTPEAPIARLRHALICVALGGASGRLTARYRHIRGLRRHHVGGPANHLDFLEVLDRHTRERACWGTAGLMLMPAG